MFLAKHLLTILVEKIFRLSSRGATLENTKMTETLKTRAVTKSRNNQYSLQKRMLPRR